MINWDLTKAKFGYDQAAVKSHSRIVVVCNTCAAIRETNFRDYRPLCRKCSISLAAKKLWDQRSQQFKSDFANKCRKQALKNKHKSSTILKKRWVKDRLGMQIMNRDTKKRQLISDSMKKKWEDAEFRDRQVTLHNSAELKKQASEIAKKLWLNPDYRSRVLATKNKPEFKEKLAISRINQPKTSSQQMILYSMLDDLKINYHKDTDIECKIGYWTFDCRIDPQPGINIKESLLIEVQGNYWHSLPETARKDKAKATYIKNYFPQYGLKYLWEHEFIAKDRIINTIKYWLGIDRQDAQSFNFPDVSQRIIDAHEAEIFISKYHYAGRVGRSGVNLGYYLGDDLIAVIVYAAPGRLETATKQGHRFSEVLELSRLAIHPLYQKKNLASYLIAKSINYIKKNKPGIKMLVSFADATYNHLGIIYKASNWTLDGIVDPDYWYVDGDGYVCHKKTLWNRASKMSMSEKEYCDKYGYNKVIGSEKRRYVFKL